MQSSEQEPQDAAHYDKVADVDQKIKALRARSDAISSCSSDLTTALSGMSEGSASFESDIQDFEWTPELKPRAMAFKQELLSYAEGLIEFCQAQKGNLRFHKMSSGTE
tara:strand:+ start:159 stop:482 length:324 start_codon:yes stop_codon:yes gene_type:complete